MRGKKKGVFFDERMLRIRNERETQGIDESDLMAAGHNKLKLSQREIRWSVGRHRLNMWNLKKKK